MKADNELYRQLRDKPCARLWQEHVVAFDGMAEPERTRHAAVIRAVGVAFAARGTAEEKAQATRWLNQLLADPSEKIRRYAMAALPKLGDDPSAEGRLLGILAAPAGDRERRRAAEALEKVGGEAALEAARRDPVALPIAQDRLAARVARRVDPGSVNLDRILTRFAGLRIHLHCRVGLERLLADEARVLLPRQLAVRAVLPGQVVAEALAPLSLGDIHRLRCFSHLGLALGEARADTPADAALALARRIAAPRLRELGAAFNDGAFRYRIDLDPSLGDASLLRRVAAEVHRLDPTLLNDPREAPWSVDIRPTPRGAGLELRPRLAPDPRFSYRVGEVAAGSHPPLAAAMARLAGSFQGEVAWDPFCGAGVELVERARLGGVERLVGTDLSAEALGHARRNLEAAGLPGVRVSLVEADFREHARVPEVGVGGVTLVITNPPMGRRVPVPDLKGLIAELFRAAASALRPGGRLVFPNPVKVEPPAGTLRLASRSRVDLGGFECRLELWTKP